MSTETLTVEPISLPTQQEYDGIPFPLILACKSSDATVETVSDWVQANRDELDAQASRHGTILFRDFPLATDQDFDAFIAAFNYENFAYRDSLSNAVRVNRTPRVFTANEAPSEVTIFLHHEMAQTPIYPSRLFFFCEHAAEEGGATPLCRSDILFRELQKRCPQFADDCEHKGLLYSNVMPAVDDPKSGMGRSWQSTLRAETKEAAEARLRELGYSWEWLDDGCLRATTPVLPAVRTLPDGRKSFFNQLIAAAHWQDERNDSSKAITFGDGTPLDRNAVATAVELGDQFAFDVPWQKGDVALVDNFVVMHGRRPFVGTRKVLASLVAANV